MKTHPKIAGQDILTRAELEVIHFASDEVSRTSFRALHVTDAFVEATDGKMLVRMSKRFGRLQLQTNEARLDVARGLIDGWTQHEGSAASWTGCEIDYVLPESICRKALKVMGKKDDFVIVEQMPSNGTSGPLVLHVECDGGFIGLTEEPEGLSFPNTSQLVPAQRGPSAGIDLALVSKLARHAGKLELERGVSIALPTGKFEPFVLRGRRESDGTMMALVMPFSGTPLTDPDPVMASTKVVCEHRWEGKGIDDETDPCPVVVVECSRCTREAAFPLVGDGSNWVP